MKTNLLITAIGITAALIVNIICLTFIAIYGETQPTLEITWWLKLSLSLLLGSAIAIETSQIRAANKNKELDKPNDE